MKNNNKIEKNFVFVICFYVLCFRIWFILRIIRIVDFFLLWCNGGEFRLWGIWFVKGVFIYRFYWCFYDEIYYRGVF